MPRPCRRWARIRLKDAVIPVDRYQPFVPFAGDGQGRRSRPTGALTDPPSIGSNARQRSRLEKNAPAVEAASGLRGEGAIRLVRSLGSRSFLLALSITKLDPDAGHARRLMQRANGLAEPGPELGSAVVVVVCRARRDSGGRRCRRGRRGGIVPACRRSWVTSPVGDSSRPHALTSLAELEPERFGFCLPMLDEVAEPCVPLGTAGPKGCQLHPFGCAGPMKAGGLLDGMAPL